MMACIGEPVSWLRLETFAVGAHDGRVAEHLAACPACAACLAEIRGSEVDLPVLVVPAAPERRRWLWWLAPAMAAVAAAVVLLVVIRRPHDQRDDIAYGVKGVGDVVLEVVRERAGTIRDDVRTYQHGDRWKVVVTCPPAASAWPSPAGKAFWIDVAVTDPEGVSYPLAPARVACGNRVVVPGAFSITGAAANRVCVRISADAAPPRRAPSRGEPDLACVTLVPE